MILSRIIKSAFVIAALLLCQAVTAVWAQPNMVQQKEQGESIEKVELTADMFCRWDDFGANANVVEVNVGEYHIGESISLPYGNGNVDGNTYADLSAYDALVLTFTEGTPRLLLNRQSMDNTSPNFIEIKSAENEHVTAEDHVWTIDLAKIVGEAGYAHLNCIKGANWANCTITKAVLIRNVKGGFAPNTPSEPGTDDYDPNAPTEPGLTVPILQYDGAGTLTISTTNPGAVIHYKLTGHDEKVYTEPITLTDNRPVYAWLTIADILNSDTVSFAPDHFVCAKPVMEYADGTLAITCPTDGAVILYEIEELTEGTYETPLTLTDNRKVVARAEAEYFLPSDTAQLIHNDFVCAKPVMEYADGTLAITCPTDGAVILYEIEELTEGTYETPLTLTDNRKVVARAEAEYFLPSDTAQLIHSDFVCAKPVMEYADGTLAISCPTDGAVILYEIEELTEGTYETPLTLTDNRKVVARAEAEYFLPSDTVQLIHSDFVCAKPVMEYADGTLAISCPTDGAVILYEIEELTEGTYETPLTLTDNRKVVARAEAEYFLPSDTAQLIHNDFVCAKPVMEYADGTLAISCPTDGAVILYEIEELAEGTYETPLTLTDNRKVVARAEAEYFLPSDTAQLIHSDFYCDDVFVELWPEYVIAECNTNDQLTRVHLYANQTQLENRDAAIERAMYEVYGPNGVGELNFYAIATHPYKNPTYSNVVALPAYATAEDVYSFMTGGIEWLYRGIDLKRERLTVHGILEIEDYHVISRVAAPTILDLQDVHEARLEPGALSGNENLLYVSLPAKIAYIGNDVLQGCPNLAAVTWNDEAAAFNISLGNDNPNLLYYTNNPNCIPYDVHNVIKNGRADRITLTDNGNFYCPQEFEARKISYEHSYEQTTGIGAGFAQGWETLTLPFDVQSIYHRTAETQIVPLEAFTAIYERSDDVKPFWLYEASGTGWVKAREIKAGQPYIISMPNNEDYIPSACLNGEVMFRANNAIVPATTHQTIEMNGIHLVPTMQRVERSRNVLVLNAYDSSNGRRPGSTFVPELAAVLPFQVYIYDDNARTRSISLAAMQHGGMTEDAIADASACGTKIFSHGSTLYIESPEERNVAIYSAGGSLVRRVNLHPGTNTVNGLPTGMYVIEHTKVVIK